MDAPLRVLLVEDSENDALLLLRQLRRGGYEPSSRRVDTAAEMEAALEDQTWDLVISDHNMPAFNSLAALDLLRARGFVDLPFIIVSGRIGEDAAVSAMKAGAHDYIMKDNLARLNSAIERELREAGVRRSRREAEAALRDSETRFRLMIEQSPLSIQIFSPDGRTVRVNRAWEELWGVTLDKIPGYNVLRDPQLMEKGLMPYIESGFAGEPTAIPPVQYEPDASMPGASEVAHRWVRAFIYPVKVADGSIQEVVLIHEDITERVNAEEERRRAEANYRSIFENAVEGIFQTTADGEFLTANPALARMYGYDSPEDLLEKVSNIADQIYADPGRREDFINLARRDGLVQDFEMRVRRGDGKTAWTSLNARAVRDASGAVVAFEGFVKDITEQKRAEQALGEIREAERRRIARELHDVVLQDLSYALQSLQVVSRMPEGDDREAETARQVQALRRSVAGIRDAIYDLRLGGGRGADPRPLARGHRGAEPPALARVRLRAVGRGRFPDRPARTAGDRGRPRGARGPRQRQASFRRTPRLGAALRGGGRGAGRGRGRRPGSRPRHRRRDGDHGDAGAGRLARRGDRGGGGRWLRDAGLTAGLARGPLRGR